MILGMTIDSKEHLVFSYLDTPAGILAFVRGFCICSVSVSKKCVRLYFFNICYIINVYYFHIVYIILLIYPISLADLRGAPGTRASPGGPNSFIFMQFSAQNMQNNSTFGSWRTPLRKILDPPLYSHIVYIIKTTNSSYFHIVYIKI